MAHLKDLILLNMVENFGFKKLESLLRLYGEPSNILKAAKKDLASVNGIGDAVADKIAALKKETLDKELRLMEEKGVYAVSIFDVNYPDNLKNSYSPPIVLYIKGEIRREDADAVAIVGSRMPSIYGIVNCEKLSVDLSARGITVVSGLARGIDTMAHKGAVKSGRTIAVLGSGLNRIYPPENRRLAEEICEKGAVVSEFPMDTPPNRHNFPKRNRVISGLSLGVIVVEAGERSGALITADFALENNREVFAVPGRVDSKVSAGTNKLIKEGARLVENADDIIDEIRSGLKYYDDRGIGKSARAGMENDAGLTEEEKTVKGLLSYDPLYIDALAEKTDMSIDKIAALLVKLEIRNVVRELPGKNFILK